MWLTFQNWLSLPKCKHFWNSYYYLVLCAIAFNHSLRIGYTLYTLTEQTDTSSHSRLFVDGRLAGSSCLVGCAGVGPPWTSWQPSLREPCALLLSSGMIHVEQKHHSTQSLDPRPEAICKTLRSNTKASYDPRRGGGGSAEKEPHPAGTYQRWNLGCHITLQSDTDIRKIPVDFH